MRFAIVTEITRTVAGKPIRDYECVALTGSELRSALRARLGSLGYLTTRARVLRALDEALDQQERQLREATRGLGPEHS